MMILKDEHFMQVALDAAKLAIEGDEVPIGACIIDENGNLLAVSGNRTRTDCDPTAHAEIVVLREAAKKIGNYRLTECSVYTTIEPCAMCAGALVQARVKRLIYGSVDERFGAVESVFEICTSSSLNHQMEIVSGVLKDECRDLISSFFRMKRKSDKSVRVPFIGEVA
jgi:tRNA(adenine34) deaminase